MVRRFFMSYCLVVTKKYVLLQERNKMFVYEYTSDDTNYC